MDAVDLFYLIRIACILVIGGVGLVFLLLIGTESTILGLAIAAVCIFLSLEISDKIYYKLIDRR